MAKTDKILLKKIVFAVISVIILVGLVFGGVFVVKQHEKYKERYTETDSVYDYVNVSYGDAKRQKYDLTVPKTASGQTGLILMIHGGGWTAGDKSGYTDLRASWAEKGYVAMAVNYRYANGKSVCNDEMLDDITSALVSAKKVCEKYGIDLTKMLLTGGSAGAHLSLIYAYKNKATAPVEPACVVSLSGPTDLSDENYLSMPYADATRQMFEKVSGQKYTEKTLSDFKDVLKSVSPISYLTEETGVPTLICYGLKEELIPKSNTDALNDKLELLGIEHDLILFENSGHGLENDSDKTQLANKLTDEYAKKYLPAVNK